MKDINVQDIIGVHDINNNKYAYSPNIQYSSVDLIEIFATHVQHLFVHSDSTNTTKLIHFMHYFPLNITK